ncbi:MAG: thioredoxin-disulfide reductase [Bacteroidaceae bacterium]|nr:thioredoxin-disulfide reductase [Bacteroidaceae bacterium]
MKPESTLPNHTRVLIIGSGPAGYTAAIYAARANLSPTLLEGLQPGGQLTTTTDIENFPGFPDGIDANELMENMRKQAESFGTKMLQNTCTNAQLNVRPFQFALDNGDNITADSVIIATGASAKYLGLPDEQKYMGRGVSACATCDGFFYRKKIVAVVGGGDTACEEASYLAGLASKVYLIVRKPFLRASKIMQERVLTNEKIEVLFETNTIGLYGENGVEGAKLVYRKGENDEKVYDLPIDGFFLAIGHHPNSELFKDYLETDTNGFIVTKDDTPCTDVPGVYVAGDVADPKYRQAIIAAGSGAKAAMEAEKYLAQ